MRAQILIIAICTLVSPSCKKEPIKAVYQEAQVGHSEVTFDNCGYGLTINHQTYAPTNLPKKYQDFSGINGENVVYIQYRLLPDSLHCFDSLGTYRRDRVLQYLEITKLLE